MRQQAEHDCTLTLTHVSGEKGEKVQQERRA